MKKVFALILSVLLCVTVCPVYSLAVEADFIVTANGGTTSRGQTIEVPIIVEKNAGWRALDLHISYDENVLEIYCPNHDDGFNCTGIRKPSVSKTEDFEVLQTYPSINTAINPDKHTANPYALSWAYPIIMQDITETGTYATITFKVKDDAVIGSTTVGVDVATISNCSGGRPTTFTSNATITVECINHTPAAPQITVAPTCTEKGTQVIKCSACGILMATEDAPATGHAWGNWEGSVDAKCGEHGEEKRVCANDATHTETRITNALEHLWDDGTITLAPTCENDGVKTYSCNRENCNGTKTQVVPATGHNFNDGVVTLAPTCEEDGVKTYTCQNDSAHTKTQSVAATGHVWDNGVITTTPGITTEGVKTYTCQNNASHKKTESLPPVGEFAVSAAGGTAERGELITVPIKVTANSGWRTLDIRVSYDANVLEIYCPNHIDGENCSGKRAPSVTKLGKEDFEMAVEYDCGNSAINPQYHTANPYSLGWAFATIEQDITEVGTYATITFKVKENAAFGETAIDIEVSTITKCSGYQPAVSAQDAVINIACINHTEAAPQITVAPTCTKKGEQVIKCSKCHVLLRTEELSATGHAWGNWEGSVDAKCGEQGEEKRVCANDATHTETRSTDALEHLWDDGVITLAPTCENGGVKTFSCTRSGCTATKNQSLDALGHNYNDGVITTAPTCDGEGVKTYTCQNDSTHTKTQTLQALGHAWDDGVITTKPTNSTKGVKTYTCQNNASHKRTEVIPALSGFVVTATGGTAGRGGFITVYIVVDQNPGWRALDIRVGYDANVLEIYCPNHNDSKNCTGSRKPSVTKLGKEDFEMAVEYDCGNSASTPQYHTANPYSLGWGFAIIEEDITETGTYAAITFKVKDDAPLGESVINITFGTITNCAGEHPAATANNGVVNVVSKSFVNAPAAPTVLEATATTVTLVATNGYEYSMDGVNWQTSNVFLNLDPNTEYTFYQRVAESDSNFASDASAPLTAKTIKHQAATPAAPTVLEVTATAVTLVATNGYEYSMDGVNWQASNVFEGLDPNTEYSFYQRVAETDTHYASEISEVLKVITIKHTVSAPAAPTVLEVTATAVTLVATNGYEYSMDGVNWQTSNVFEGLDPVTEYTFYQRSAETDTHYASEVSEVLAVTTLRAYTPGDVDDSGEITIDDVVALAQIVAGWQNVNHNPVALDANGDGEVTIDDVVLLAQFVAGWEVTIN